MIERQKRIAIMGGTFDPIHYGHLVLAEDARWAFGIDRVIFIPAGAPPHKRNRQVSDKEQRYDMVSMAIEGNDSFEASRIEIDRQGRSYSIDTVKTLRDIYGEDVEILFITGADAIAEIETWHDAEQLLALCTFIAASRPGIDGKLLRKKIAQIRDKYNAKIYFFEIPEIEISSTAVRDRRRNGKPIRYLVPPQVERYIYRKNLYAETNGIDGVI